MSRLALSPARALPCWATKHYGQLGFGSTDTESLEPVSVCLPE